MALALIASGALHVSIAMASHPLLSVAPGDRIQAIFKNVHCLGGLCDHCIGYRIGMRAIVDQHLAADIENALAIAEVARAPSRWLFDGCNKFCPDIAIAG